MMRRLILYYLFIQSSCLFGAENPEESSWDRQLIYLNHQTQGVIELYEKLSAALPLSHDLPFTQDRLNPMGITIQDTLAVAFQAGNSYFQEELLPLLKTIAQLNDPQSLSDEVTLIPSRHAKSAELLLDFAKAYTQLVGSLATATEPEYLSTQLDALRYLLQISGDWYTSNEELMKTYQLYDTVLKSNWQQEQETIDADQAWWNTFYHLTAAGAVIATSLVAYWLYKNQTAQVPRHALEFLRAQGLTESWSNIGILMSSQPAGGRRGSLEQLGQAVFAYLAPK
jgi:hypothetical protein